MTVSPKTSRRSSVALRQCVDRRRLRPAGPHSFSRGGPVSAWDAQTRSTVDVLADEIDAEGAIAVREAAIAAEWSGPDVWVHGDVTGSNFLMTGDRLCGVIDFGCASVGDPACDLTPAWTMFDDSSRRRFVDAIGCDDGTWARARGWALWKALIDIPGRPVDDPGRAGTRFGWRSDAAGVITNVITDFHADRLNDRCRHVRRPAGVPLSPRRPHRGHKRSNSRAVSRRRGPGR